MRTDDRSKPSLLDDLQRPGGWIARGKAIGESGKHLPPRGEFLGRCEAWGLDVHEGSPQPWIDAWLSEQSSE
jgi:hypothetical protein